MRGTVGDATAGDDRGRGARILRRMSDTVAPPVTGPLLLIDGYSLAYRAFHALPDTIATQAGFPTNALYGLSAMMMKMLAEERPARVVVAWDPPGKTFRHEQEPTYKANRSATPDLFREQRKHFRPLMEAFGFVNTELEGFEADDVLGTLALRWAEAGEDVMILTGDRDAFQLVSDRVSVIATGRGVTDTTIYTPDAVVERYGIGPELMVDFRGMVGDPSDNLPGVPGIGEKGASQLLQKYGSLDEVLAHADEQTPKRREVLTEHADAARRTRNLALIRTDAPVDLDLEDVPPLDFGPERMAALREVFGRVRVRHPRAAPGHDRRRCGAGGGAGRAAAGGRRRRGVAGGSRHALRRRARRRPGRVARGMGRRRRGRRGARPARSATGVGEALARVAGGGPGRLPRRQGRGAGHRAEPAAGARHDDRRVPARSPPAGRVRPGRHRRGRGRRGERRARPLGARRRAGARAGGASAHGPRGQRAGDALRRDRAAGDAGAGRDGGGRRAPRRAPPGRDRRPRARQRRRAARPDLGAGRRRVRHRVAQAARPGAVRAARAAHLPQGQDRLQHRPAGAEAAGGQAPDRAADRPLPRADQARQHLPVGAARPGGRERPPAHHLQPGRRRDRAPVVHQPQPAEHPGAHRDRPRDPRRLHHRSRWRAAELRLQPGGAAHPGPLLGRARPGRRVPSR